MQTKKHRIEEIEGKNISVNIREGNNGDVLLIHGLGCSKESFDDLFEGKWLEGRRLIAPDLLGFGNSSKPQDYSYTMEEHAKSLQVLTNKLNVINPVVIAHSMGGAIGLLLIKRLSSVKYFFSLEGNLVDEDCTYSKAAQTQSEDDFIINSYAVNPVKYRCRQLESEPDSSPVGYYRSSVSLVEMSESGELLTMFKEMPYPKTYIYGYENRDAKAIKVLDGQDVVGIENCGHFMLNDNPNRTYSVVEDRLACQICT